MSAFLPIKTAFSFDDAAAGDKGNCQPHQGVIKAVGRLSWYLDKVGRVEPAPLGRQRSRDAKDDPYLAAALAAKAQVVVTFDKDLLARQPFGISIITPAQLLKEIKG